MYFGFDGAGCHFTLTINDGEHFTYSGEVNIEFDRNYTATFFPVNSTHYTAALATYMMTTFYMLYIESTRLPFASSSDYFYVGAVYVFAYF